MFEAELWNVNAYGDHLPRAHHLQCNALVLCLLEDLKYDELLMLVETIFSVLEVISDAKLWNQGGEADQ